MGYMATMIDFAERLKTARQEASKVFGDQYNDMVGPVKESIVRDMAATGMTPLDSTFRLAKKVLDAGDDPLLHLAAGVELVMGKQGAGI